MHETRRGLWFNSQKTVLTFAAMLILAFSFYSPLVALELSELCNKEEQQEFI